MKNTPIVLTALLVSMLLTACGGNGNKSASPKPTSSSSLASSVMSSSVSSSSMSSSSTPMLKLSVVVTNLTAGQPLSPTAIVIHKPGFKAFTVGMPASVELEQIAESGNPDAFLADVLVNTATLTSGKASAGVPPGKSATIMLETPLMDADKTQLRLTALSMLGNTNDGFTGLNGIDISKLAVGEAMTIDTISYDAGTEKNTESAATVPGPAAGGEGFNPMRDDSPSTVAMHPGIISKDDGNIGSALTSINRWDNPIARVTITRLAP
jgi:hypothetical protein